MNSPQSQKDAVGSMVLRYVNADTTKANAAAILFHSLNVFSVIAYKYSKFCRNYCAGAGKGRLVEGSEGCGVEGAE